VTQGEPAASTKARVSVHLKFLQKWFFWRKNPAPLLPQIAHALELPRTSKEKEKKQGFAARRGFHKTP